MMEKKILLAVDDSRHSKNAIHYAVIVSSFVKNLLIERAVQGQVYR
ncbi:MAG: hypothetical protein R6W88_08960 [Desulfobacterales bacterium]